MHSHEEPPIKIVNNPKDRELITNILVERNMTDYTKVGLEVLSLNLVLFLVSRLNIYKEMWQSLEVAFCTR